MTTLATPGALGIFHEVGFLPSPRFRNVREPSKLSFLKFVSSVHAFPFSAPAAFSRPPSEERNSLSESPFSWSTSIDNFPSSL